MKDLFPGKQEACGAFWTGMTICVWMLSLDLGVSRYGYNATHLIKRTKPLKSNPLILYRVR